MTAKVTAIPGNKPLHKGTKLTIFLQEYVGGWVRANQKPNSVPARPCDHTGGNHLSRTLLCPSAARSGAARKAGSYCQRCCSSPGLKAALTANRYTSVPKRSSKPTHRLALHVWIWMRLQSPGWFRYCRALTAPEQHWQAFSAR